MRMRNGRGNTASLGAARIQVAQIARHFNDLTHAPVFVVVHNHLVNCRMRRSKSRGVAAQDEAVLANNIVVDHRSCIGILHLVFCLS